MQINAPILSRLFALLQENQALSLASLAGQAGCSREIAATFRHLYLQWHASQKEASHATHSYRRQ